MGLTNLSELNLSTEQDARPVWSVFIGDYRYVLYTTNKALVFKDGDKEPSYEITPVGCSCPSDRYKTDACKHRRVISFLGDGSSGTPATEPEFNANLGGVEADSPEYSLDDLFG